MARSGISIPMLVSRRDYPILYPDAWIWAANSHRSGNAEPDHFAALALGDTPDYSKFIFRSRAWKRGLSRRGSKTFT